MVLGTAFVEVLGSPENDIIIANNLTINYGLGGNDSYFLTQNSVFVNAGGTGGDTYGADGTLQTGAAIVIETGNTAGDVTIASPTAFDPFRPQTQIFLIDGRHLGGIDPVTGYEFYLIDFADPANKIERFINALGDVTFEELSASLPLLPSFIGNQTWDYAISQSQFLAPAGLTSADQMNLLIDFVKLRATTLEATDGNDVLLGGTGNDTISGLGGNDQISGDLGDDVLLGDAGNDRLFGNEGNDTLFGGDGKDRLFGGDGIDILFGGEGIDQMNGQDGSDIHVLQLGDGYARIKGFDPSTDKLGFVKGEVRLAQLDLSTRSGSAVLAIDNDILGGTLGVGLDELTRRNVVFVKQSEVIG
jgi:Ca2+-binding RTX toxin-like protein